MGIGWLVLGRGRILMQGSREVGGRFWELAFLDMDMYIIECYSSYPDHYMHLRNLDVCIE